MIFDGINLETCTLEELKEMELGHVANKLLELATSKRLCSLEGKEVLAEYQFKGTFKEVVKQLDDYSLEIDALGLTEKDRKDIIMGKIRLLTHRDMKKASVEYEAIREAIEEGDEDKVTDLTNQYVIMANIAHENKMCECFTNSL